MELNNYIEHTNLNNTATFEDIEKLCKEAIKYHFKTVCVHPFYVGVVKEYLKNTNINVCTVVGFPLGMNTMQVKQYEAIDATSKGADEIDMVINIGAARDGRYSIVSSDIATVVETARIAGEKVNKKIIVN